MSVVPKKQLEKIVWAEDHVAPFNTNAVAIGTTVPEAAAFQSKTEAARDAMTAAVAARSASKNASLTLKNAITALDVAAQGIIKQVRSKAETTNNPNVYALASIPAPATPQPVGDPGTPEALKCELNGDGSLMLSWKCANPVGAYGTIYQVWRQIGGAGEFTFIGAAGEKKFVDSTVPAGTSFITYKLRATRSTVGGLWATFNVQFGMGGGGAMSASVEQGPTSPKMAA